MWEWGKEIDFWWCYKLSVCRYPNIIKLRNKIKKKDNDIEKVCHESEKMKGLKEYHGLEPKIENSKVIVREKLYRNFDWLHTT